MVNLFQWVRLNRYISLPSEQIQRILRQFDALPLFVTFDACFSTHRGTSIKWITSLYYDGMELTNFAFNFFRNILQSLIFFMLTGSLLNCIGAAYGACFRSLRSFHRGGTNCVPLLFSFWLVSLSFTFNVNIIGFVLCRWANDSSSNSWSNRIGKILYFLNHFSLPCPIRIPAIALTAFRWRISIGFRFVGPLFPQCIIAYLRFDSYRAE